MFWGQATCREWSNQMEARATLVWSWPCWAPVHVCLGTMVTSSPTWLPVQRGCQPRNCYHEPVVCTASDHDHGTLCVLPQTMTTRHRVYCLGPWPPDTMCTASDHDHPTPWVLPRTMTTRHHVYCLRPWPPTTGHCVYCLRPWPPDTVCTASDHDHPAPCVLPQTMTMDTSPKGLRALHTSNPK